MNKWKTDCGDEDMGEQPAKTLKSFSGLFKLKARKPHYRTPLSQGLLDPKGCDSL